MVNQHVEILRQSYAVMIDVLVMSRRAHANRSLSDELLLSPDLSDCIIAFSDGSHFRQGTNVYNTGFSVIFPQYKFVSVCGTIVPSATNTSFQVDFPLSNIRAELFAILQFASKKLKQSIRVVHHL